MARYNIEQVSIKDCEQADALVVNLKRYESAIMKESTNERIEKTEDYIKIKDNIVLVAKTYSKVIGVGRGYITSDYLFLDELFVDEKYRNSHIGKSIYNKFINIGEEKKIKSLIIPTLYDNIESQKFYEKIGAKKMYLQYEILLNDSTK